MDKACFCLDGPVSALCTDERGLQIAVAGRNVLKVLSYNNDDEGLVELQNLRPGSKHANLNYSAIDIAWSTVEDNILASAATNGAVVLWDLNKVHNNKADHVFPVHTRTVNKVRFHPVEPGMLLSGSHDGTIKLLDRRKGSVVSCFDSGRGAEDIRDLQFVPLQPNTFASVSDSGRVKFWDLRSSDKVVREFTAHNGLILSMDFSDDGKLLATGGRDRQIKVWDHQNQASKQAPEYFINTALAVKVVRWRPTRPFQLASCALSLDSNIYVWDIRRPYVPFAAFEEHKDVCTGIAWSAEPHKFFSCSKDGTLRHHYMREGSRPGDFACPMGLDVQPSGDICLAISERILHSTGYPLPPDKFPMPFGMRQPAIFKRAAPSPSDVFKTPELSDVAVLSATPLNSNRPLDMEWFVQSALRYKLTSGAAGGGCTLGEACDQNAEVAKGLGRNQVAQTWLMLKLMLAPTGPGKLSIAVPHNSMDMEWRKLLDRKPSGERALLDSGAERRLFPLDAQSSTVSDIQDCAEPEGSDTDIEKQVTNLTTGVQGENFFFADGDYGRTVFDELDAFAGAPGGRDEDWELPHEAIVPRTVLGGTPNTPRLSSSRLPTGLGSPNVLRFSPISVSTSEFGNASAHANDVSEQAKSGAIPDGGFLGQIFLPFSLRTPTWNPLPVVKEMLTFYADQADLQMCVSVMLLFKDKLTAQVPPAEQERWYQGYLDLLSHFQLWTVSALVVKLCPLPNIQQLSQQSTLMVVCCMRCGKPTDRGYYCGRCGLIGTCSVCQQAVRGLYAWCQACSHGGHVKHLQEWFEKHDSCPSGCPCLCKSRSGNYPSRHLSSMSLPSPIGNSMDEQRYY